MNHKYSKYLDDFKIINDENINHTIITPPSIPNHCPNSIHNYNTIQIDIDDGVKHPCFGIELFPSNILYFLVGKKIEILKCKLQFSVKIMGNNDCTCKITIFTGLKWIPIDKLITNTSSTTIEIIEDFDLNYNAYYRIGIQNINNKKLIGNSILFSNISLIPLENNLFAHHEHTIKTIKTFSHLLIQFLKQQNKIHLAPYYCNAIQQNYIFLKHDILTLGYMLRQNINKNCKIVEVAAGIAQLSMLLCLFGFCNLTCIEYDHARINIIQNIKSEFQMDNINIINNNFLDEDLSKFDIILSMNSKGSYIVTEKQYLNLENSILNGSKFIARYNRISNTGEWIFKKLDVKFQKTHIGDDIFIYEKK